MGFMPNNMNMNMPNINPEDKAISDAAGVFTEGLMTIVDKIVGGVISKDKTMVGSGMVEMRQAMIDAGVTETYKQVALSSIVLALGMSMKRGQ